MSHMIDMYIVTHSILPEGLVTVYFSKYDLVEADLQCSIGKIKRTVEYP